MIVLEEQGVNGYDNGLNGLRIAKAFKKVSLNNAAKFAKASAMLSVGVPPGIAMKKAGLNGYEDGLNGLKIAKALKKVTLKGAVKVVKNVAPMALSFIPVAGGVLGSVAGKILTNKDGSKSLAGRAVESVQKVAKSKGGKAVIAAAKPLVKNATTALMQDEGTLPNDEQVATLAEQKGTTPQEELDTMATAKQAAAKTTTPVAKDNTMFMVGGAIAVVGIGYLALK